MRQTLQKSKKNSLVYYPRTWDKSGSNSPPFQGNVQIPPSPDTMHNQMPWVCPGGVLKLQFDRYISVQRFFHKLNESKWNCSEPKWTMWHRLWEKNLLIFGSEMWYVSDFSWNIVIIIVEAVRFHHISCGSWSRARLYSVRRTVSVIMCSFNWTKDRIWTWTGYFYAAQKQDYHSEERQNSPSYMILVC